VATIRAFEERDAQAVADVYYRSVHEVAASKYTLEQRNGWAPAVPDGTKWLNDLVAFETLVAVNDDDDVIAWISMRPDGYIDMIFCLPEAVGRGIASDLYRAIERTACDRQISVLTAHASLFGQRFFLKHGWTIDIDETWVRNGIELPRAQMSKRLGA
jgi:putative acetyltransferase